MDWLAPLGAWLTLALGMFGLLAPMHAARLVGLTPRDRLGVSELRATYGGLFIGLGLACLVWPSPTTFIAAAMAWTGAGLARLLSIAVDRNLSRLNVAGVMVELLLGSLLWAGAA
jgi:hypothetical protein